MNIEKHHAAEWSRCIMEAGATADIAARSVELATLAGLFDIHRSLETSRGIDKFLQELRAEKRQRAAELPSASATED